MSSTAKSFGNTKIRVEGNTDNVGGLAMNKALSEKRAQSVANYLRDTYEVDFFCDNKLFSLKKKFVF